MNLRERLRKIVEDGDTKAGRAFDLASQAVILISLISFCVETLPDLSHNARRCLFIIEMVTVILFTLEYLLRVFVVDSKFRFIFSFYGLIDLAAIAPFYLSLGCDLRAIRILRMFRLVRAFKLLRYNKALQRFATAFRDIKEELVVFAVATMLVVFVSSVGIYYCECGAQPEQFGSVFHCMWWSICTLTTVGYGDVYPITVGGKVFTGLLLIVALGIVAVPSGLLASALTKARDD